MATKPKAAKSAPAEEAVVVGSFVDFLGYGDEVPENERMLEKDHSYEVIELTDTGYVVKFDNPDFDSKKKVDADKNPQTLETEVFPTEVKLGTAPEGAVKTPTATSTKVKGGKAPKAPAPVVEKVKAEKPAKAPKPPKEPKVVVDPDALPELAAEQEDADVLAIVNESEDLVADAQELEGNIGKNEYHLGGVLYHIKKSGSYKELNPLYTENAGFAAFLNDYMNVDYRKAQHLIDIYVTFSQLGIPNPAEKVAEIGWTKASKITKPMREEGAVADDLLKLATENTVADLSIAIKDQSVEVGGTKGEVKKRVTLKLRFFEEDGTSVMSIIQSAKVQQSLSSDEEALQFILEDWAASNGTSTEVADAPSQKAPVGTAKPKAKAAPKLAAAA